MAGFRKAKAEQAALKVGLYGPAGSGKTLTALMMAEGLASLIGKRIAVVDTERGTDFYCKDVAARAAHPNAFDFDALYTRSLTDVLSAVKSISPAEHGIIIIDSITHVWEAAQAAYNGKTTSVGTIPLQAWGKIKKPYKELIAFLLSSPIHIIFCGREGNRWEEDEDTGELKQAGKKMKAEGETPYEPHILLQMVPERDRNGNTIIRTWAEKDRTGVLSGKTITLWPVKDAYANVPFDLLVKPILPLLGHEQAKVQSQDESAAKDAESLAADEVERIKNSERILSDFSARLTLCKSASDLKAVGKDITPDIKGQMMPADIAELRTIYLAREQEVK